MQTTTHLLISTFGGIIGTGYPTTRRVNSPTNGWSGISRVPPWEPPTHSIPRSVPKAFSSQNSQTAKPTSWATDIKSNSKACNQWLSSQPTTTIIIIIIHELRFKDTILNLIRGGCSGCCLGELLAPFWESWRLLIQRTVCYVSAAHNHWMYCSWWSLSAWVCVRMGYTE